MLAASSRAIDAIHTATMQFSSKTTAALSLLALLALAAAKPCPAADANLKSLNKGDGRVSVTFRSQIDEELQVYWMTRDGEQHDVGILEPLGEVMHQSFEGHAFRVRRMLGEKEVVAETLLGRSTRQRVLIEACGAGRIDLIPTGRTRRVKDEVKMRPLPRIGNID